MVAPALADFSGRVTDVLDGDLLDVSLNNQVFRIRLADIDAPEPGQRFSREARAMLSAKAEGRTARVHEQGMDLRGYTVARVTVGGQDLGLAQVQAGMAWRAEQSNVDEYRLAEERAREQRKGLWRDISPVPPWEWLARRGNR